MKKTFTVVCLVLALLFLFTGCIRYSATIKVNSNGKADVTLLTAGSDSIGEDADSVSLALSLTEEEIAAYKAKGYGYEEYRDEEAEYTGYILSRTGVDLKDLSGSSGEEGLNALLDSGFTVNGKKVTLDFRPFSDEEYEESGEYFSMIKLNHGYMRIILELPVKPTAHNATSVSSDGKTLAWDLTKLTAADTVHAEFTLPGSSFLIWLLPILAVLAVLFFLFRRKTAARAQEQPAPAAPAPETPEQQESALQEEPAPDGPSQEDE